MSDAPMDAIAARIQTALGAELQQSLTQIPAGTDKAEGILIGQAVGDRILARGRYDPRRQRQGRRRAFSGRRAPGPGISLQTDWRFLPDRSA